MLFVLRKFFPYATNRDGLSSVADSFVLNTAESDQEFLVSDRIEHHRAIDNQREYFTLHRLWVGRKDGLIRRYELTNPYFRQTVLLDDVKPNADLVEDDLRYAPPFWTRFSMTSNPVPFAVILSSLAFAIGVVVWWPFAVVRGMPAMERLRSRLWKGYKVVAVVVVVCLLALALLTMGGQGHPPPIIVALVAATYAGLGLVLAACLILGSYVVPPAATVLARFGRAKRGTGL